MKIQKPEEEEEVIIGKGFKIIAKKYRIMNRNLKNF